MVSCSHSDASPTFAFMDFSPSSLWVSRSLSQDPRSLFRPDPFHPHRRAKARLVLRKRLRFFIDPLD